MITQANLDDLETKGFTVVPNVLTVRECDEAISEYRTWLDGFKPGYPETTNSIIRGYNIGHLDVTWRLRLKVKPVFSQLWGTEKLLTSLDSVALGRPPEDGVEEFEDPNKHWLHADCTPARAGLHAYQGALYLEEQTADDWTFLVMEGSHNILEEVFQKFPDRADSARRCGCHFDLSEEDVKYFMNSGCKITRVPVPKGGVALWDSRLVHANARPLKNRKNAGRWRYVAFISMTPAIWANEEDYKKHEEIFNQAGLSTHWSSQGFKPAEFDLCEDAPYQCTIPEVARTKEALQLAGIIPYDFNDGEANADDVRPVWRRGDDVILKADEDKEKQFANGHI